MRRSLIAAVVLLALGGMGAGVGGGVSMACAQDATPLPATPKLPSFGRGLFGPRTPDKATDRPGAAKPAPDKSTGDKSTAERPLPDRPTLLSHPASTLEGREATRQALQDCYAREASKARNGGSSDTRIRRLRLACDNEEIADTRAFLRWSKLGDARQSRRIVNAIQQDDAEKALTTASTRPAP